VFRAERASEATCADNDSGWGVAAEGCVDCSGTTVNGAADHGVRRFSSEPSDHADGGPPLLPETPPAPAKVATPAVAVGSVNERFLALCAAVDAADRGNFSLPLPLQGHDRLTLMARQLQRLFSRVLATTSTSDGPVDGVVDPLLHRENNRLKYLIANTPAIIYSSVPTGDGTMTFCQRQRAAPAELQAGRNGGRPQLLV